MLTNNDVKVIFSLLNKRGYDTSEFKISENRRILNNSYHENVEVWVENISPTQPSKDKDNVISALKEFLFMKQLKEIIE